jgi:glycosyltransferase involved in cell wall biosynthesis
LVILEAMSCGTPIVSFDVGGVKEALIHKQNGYIAKYKDVNDLLNGIKYIFGLEKSDLEKNSQNSIQRVKENFTLDIMTENYIKLYKQILSKKQNL